MKRVYRYSKQQFQTSMPGIYRILDRQKTIVKYIISGGTAAATDLILLYFLTDILNIHYLLSASIAFIIAFFISFYLQKFWTFRDNNKERIYKQISLYFIVGVTNLCINIGGMYILVDKFEIMYILAQILMGGFIAVASFLIYRFVIFSARGGSSFGEEKQHKIQAKNNAGDNLKILIATGIFPPDIGGPATMLKALAESLISYGLKVKVITYSDKAGDNKSEYNESNIETHRVTKSCNTKFRHLKYFYQMYKLAKWADLVYVTDTYSVGRFAYLIKRLLGKKYIVRFAGDSAWEIAFINRWINDNIKVFKEKIYNPVIERLKRKRKEILINSDGVIAVSDFMNRHAQDIGVSSDKVKTIYNSVDFIKQEFNFKLKEKLDISNHRIILTGGRLIPIKGIDYLIKAFNLFKKDDRFLDVKLMIVGNGPEQKNLRNVACNSEAKNDIVFIGKVPRDEIFSYYQLASAFVLNSIHESFSHMLLEALSLGKPVIATYSGGNPEIIENEKTGLLVNYGEIKELANAIKRILTEEKWRDAGFKNKCITSMERFNWDNNIKQTINFINNTIHE